MLEAPELDAVLQVGSHETYLFEQQPFLMQPNSALPLHSCTSPSCFLQQFLCPLITATNKAVQRQEYSGGWEERIGQGSSVTDCGMEGGMGVRRGFQEQRRFKVQLV